MLIQKEVDQLVEAIRTSKVKLDKDKLWALLCNAGIHDYEFVSEGSATGALLQCFYCQSQKWSKPWKRRKG